MQARRDQAALGHAQYCTAWHTAEVAYKADDMKSDMKLAFIQICCYSITWYG